jgi:hypothetical protein
MFTLRYAFDPTCFFDSLLAQGLANALSEQLELKLENSNTAQAAVLNNPTLYGLFSKPLLQSDFYLHSGPGFKPDPACINLWWGSSFELSSHLASADQRWSMTHAGLAELVKAFPTESEALPLCLDMSLWQKSYSPSQRPGMGTRPTHLALAGLPTSQSRINPIRTLSPLGGLYPPRNGLP